MKITHLQSSSELIEAGGLRILTDPWLVQGEYYGSWYHYPPFPKAVEDIVCDYIYVSHIHPDHLSRKTFARLNPATPVLIHRFEEKFLKRSVEALGFEVIELDHARPHDLGGGVTIEIHAADNCDPQLCGRFFGCAPAESRYRFTQIDSLCVISDGRHTILNTNDCPFDLSRPVLDGIAARHGQIDLLLVGYAGAGPFPQCFAFADDALRQAAADRKAAQFIAQAVKYIDRLAPKMFMPFAGTYVLGGRLGRLNRSRGVPTPGEALRRISDAISGTARGVLMDAGVTLDLATGETDGGYREPDSSAVDAFVASTAGAAYDYDALEPVDDDALGALMCAAHPRFAAKAAQIGFDSPTRIVVRSDAGFAMGFSAAEPPEPQGPEPSAAPFVEITLDRRLLGQLLRGPKFAHWNNAEIGSHLNYRREPEQFERGLYFAMSAFHV